jgi:opacity protein-like surface antigen
MDRSHRACTLLLLSLLLAPALPAAQDRLFRDGRWEFTLTSSYQFPQGLDFEGGTRMETSGRLGFGMRLGYDYGEHFTLSFGGLWQYVDYDADLAADAAAGGTVRVSTSYNQWAGWGEGDFNLLKGPVTPFLTAGLGWSVFEPGVPAELPHSGCYWDPWYGRRCTCDYPSRQIGAFSYKAGLGLRWDVNPMFFMRFGYEEQWHQLDHSDGDAGFGVARLDLGFFF